MAFHIATVLLENGARLGISGLPGCGGAGLADVSTIARWNPSIVVSMTDTLEMERHNMGDLDAMLAAAEIDWAHFPIRDFGAPHAEADWQSLSHRLHNLLDNKGAILAHCYGGHGRSGMVLVRLMAERGITPQDALARLRKVRPGAVERQTQYDWAAQGYHKKNER